MPETGGRNGILRGNPNSVADCGCDSRVFDQYGVATRFGHMARDESCEQMGRGDTRLPDQTAPPVTPKPADGH